MQTERNYEHKPAVLVILNIFRQKLKTRCMKLSIVVFANVLGVLWGLQGQEPLKGPLIQEYGAAWDIPEVTYATDTSATFKAVFDVMNSPQDHTEVNPWIETAARFLNMHARAGVDPRQLKVALVVHNKASTDLLENTEYKKRFGVDNPNGELLHALMETGAQVIFCGQSSFARQVPVSQTIEGVQLSLSAMTALIQLQNQGYQLIKF
jgi:intracellular sulfur oxidation DsrE/DsrF family protein